MITRMELPSLTAEERTHSECVLQRIQQEIAAQQGWISFERFMELALYEPGLGYYSAGANKFGAEGDFVTAPEISPLYSRCLARQCAQVFEHLGGGDILEIGAGSGIMAVDLLLELERLQHLPGRYFILEVSAELRQRQRSTVEKFAPALAHKIEWLDTLPSDLHGVVLANEVLDALPVQRFCVRGAHVNALGVTWQLGQLDWSEIRADSELTARVHKIQSELEAPLADNYTSEINMRLQPWVQGIAEALTAGVIVFVDYGLPRRQLYRPERNEGTLLCHFRHRFHANPLINVGLQDIGSWVDFTAVAEAAVQAGLTVAGFTTQAHFLLGNGIDKLLAEPGEDLRARLQIARQAMILTLPAEMGERFKVLGLCRNYTAPLQGFAIRDLTASL